MAVKTEIDKRQSVAKLYTKYLKYKFTGKISICRRTQQMLSVL